MASLLRFSDRRLRARIHLSTLMAEDPRSEDRTEDYLSTVVLMPMLLISWANGRSGSEDKAAAKKMMLPMENTHRSCYAGLLTQSEP
jgi:hypothetical protein